MIKGGKNENKKTELTSSKAAAVNDNSDNACVVCFKNVDIYSIGECDHPVCYECSTRMRVLCQQNECPICRQVLSKVIFTYDKLPYRELEAKNRSEYYSQQYKIGFYTNKIQQDFFALLDHPCPKCNNPPFRSFEDLKSHVIKEHHLHYCDLCTENLKIFSFERRCYTQSELGLHRVKGDVDNKSHRGHPLCEYCNCRYLDRDELFRHMRRTHYFCHFCDADGSNEFYEDYEALAEHFRIGHFLCEEGKCATEKFTGVFRTEIDYKAHVANVHGKTLNKLQAKQARTLQLEITLGPRGRSGQLQPGIANVRSRGNNDDSHEYIHEMNPQCPTTIDAHNEQDFPSLAGASGSTVTLLRPTPLSIRNRTGSSGLARTKENFPELCGGVGLNGLNSNRSSQQAPISSVIKNSSATGASARSGSSNSTSGTGMIIHVSNRPTTSSSQQGTQSNSKKAQPSKHDFPALPGSAKEKVVFVQRDDSILPSTTQVTNRASPSTLSQRGAVSSAGKKATPAKSDFPALLSKQKIAAQLDEDMLPSYSNLNISNVSAKHRTLVEDYVSVANPRTFQKIQMVQKEDLEAKAKKIVANKNTPALTTQDFPALALGGSSSNKPSVAPPKASWIPSDKKQRELENRKMKVAPAPLLSTSTMTKPAPKLARSLPNNSNTVDPNSNSSKKEKKNQKNPNLSNEKKSPEVLTTTKKSGTNKSAEKNNNDTKSANANSSDTPINGNGKGGVDYNSSFPRLCGPPPGFTADVKAANALAVKPPPGFQDVTLNSFAKLPNRLTFTSSLGESYSIVPTHTYIQPPESITRNQKLVTHFKEALQTPQALDEFRHISQKFREGVYKAQPYYEHCQAALKENFDTIFPELLALLPDISMQQSLYLVHSQRVNNLSTIQKKTIPKLEVCTTCKQVLLSSDINSHSKIHAINENFPSLRGKSSIDTVNRLTTATQK